MTNAKTKFIRVRATESERDYANRVAVAVGEDLSAIIRAHIANLGAAYRVQK